MKKLFSVVILTILSGICVLAQDVITRKNGEDIQAKVLEVGQNEVKYVKSSSPDGPTYIISKADIFQITYKDGTKDVFSDYSQEMGTTALSPEQISQLRPNMKYRELKNIYSTKSYKFFKGEERCNPAVMGLCSFLIPGLGQIICGEGGRGVLQLAGNWGLQVIGYSLMFASTGENPDVESDDSGNEGAVLGGLACVAGAIALDVFSIVDAVKVAKVKNMYKEDMRNYSYHVSLSPYYDVVRMNSGAAPVAGLTLRIDLK